jgi:hypothetical protein
MGVGLLVIVLAGLVPPWVQQYDGRKGESAKSMGYALIFTPPPATRDSLALTVRPDYGRLLVTWAVIAGLTGSLLWITQPKVIATINLLDQLNPSKDLRGFVWVNAARGTRPPATLQAEL